MRRLKRSAAVVMAVAMGLTMLAGCDKKTEKKEEKTTTEAEEKEEEEAAQPLGVKDGDVIIDLQFEDGVDDFVTYSNGGNFTMEGKDGEMDCDIKNIGVQNHADQVYYDGFALYNGCVYNYSFDVRCDVARSMEWRLQINGGDYHAYAGDVIEIGEDTLHVSVEFTMEEDSDPAPRLVFNMGKFDGMDNGMAEHHIYIDNVLLTAVDASNAQQIEPVPVPNKVKVNQLGYGKDDKKVATVSNIDADSFDVVDAKSGDVVYSGDLSKQFHDRGSDEALKTADFSELKDEGTYKIVTDKEDESYEFAIGEGIYDDVYKDAILMLYNQRCGIDLDGSISGDFAHDACHTGDAIIYGTDKKINVNGGWHDAGDYGRYVVSGAKTVQDLFLAYEDTEAGKLDDVGIPESGNGTPDLLDEVKYELDWMLKMQDGSSGGVYHKVTCANFPETVLSVEENDQLICCPISNTATGDFAAVMAKASVIYAEYDKDFAKSCLEAAKKAWKYLEKHDKDDSFTNPEDIVTGEYPDKSYKDEYLWAATELYIATKEDTYKTYIDDTMENSKTMQFSLGWASIGYYALYDYCRVIDDNDAMKQKILDGADKLVKEIDKDGYGSSMGTSYPWGSNMYVANNGMLLSMAANLSGDDKYLDYAKDQLNFIFGRNSVSYCYVTGYGTVSPHNPHHRPSQVLGEVMPGMLIGGADADLEDPYAKAVLFSYAAESRYVDNSQSFSCNEVTIYWNSPLIYLLSEVK